MKKILFFINTLGGGGAEKVLVDLVNSLDHSQYKVDVVSVTGGVHESRLSNHINYYKIIKTNNSFFNRLFVRIFYHLPVSLVNRLIKKDNYDIEIAYIEGFPTKVIGASKGKSKKVAFVHCDVSVQNVLDKIYRTKKQCINDYNRFDRVCFVSDAAKNGFETITGSLKNSVVVHNIIDFNDVKQKSQFSISQEYETSGMKLISVGRLSKEKGYERLIKVLSEIKEKYSFELWLLGTGERLSAIEEQIKAFGLNNIKLLGFQSNPYAFINKADLLICPSFYEGYSTVAVESMILGVPVLTTECAGMKEILENGKCGIIVENSEEGIKKGLMSLFEDEMLYSRIKNGAQMKKESYTNELAVKEYDELFKEITK